MITVMKSRACDSLEDLRNSLHWLPIEQRIVFKINLLTYKCLNNKVPKYLQNLLTHEQLGKSTRSEVTRRLQERLVSKRSGDRAFQNAAPSASALLLTSLSTNLKPAYVKLLSIRFVFTLTIHVLL